MITVQTASTGDRQVPTKWAGQWLAVHRPIRRDGLSKAPALWTVTLQQLGLSIGEIAAPLSAVVALAKAWDVRAASWDPIAQSGHSRGWPWGKRLGDDIRRVQAGRPPLGPRDLTPAEALESAGTAAQVEAAVRAAMGVPVPMSEDEASEQWPADLTKATEGHGAITRRDGVLSFCWMPKGSNYSDGDAIQLWGWYPIPSAGDVERWCLGSAAETPAGDTVEPDHPDAWPRLLGLI
ncbi:MAG: hypothetical protein VW779_00650 [Halieaceae bacterium]